MPGRITSNEGSYATALLQQLSQITGKTIPINTNTISWIESWVTREGGGGANNPMNSTLVMPNSTTLSGNPDGVQNYATLQDGVVSNAKTLANGLYPAIITALESGNPQALDKGGITPGSMGYELLKWSGGLNANGTRKINPKTGQPEGYDTLSGVTPSPVSNVGGVTDQSTAGGFNSDGVSDNSGQTGVTLTQFIAENGLGSVANDPQIAPLLQAWGSDSISDDEFEQKLTQTNWYKNTPQLQRTYLIDQATDPATLKQNIVEETSNIASLATKLGVPLTPTQATGLATQVITKNLSQDQITQALAKNVNYTGPTGATLTGESATDLQQLQQIYKDYQVPVTTQKLNTQLQQVISGLSTTTDIQSQVAAQAKTLWSNNPQLASQISPSMSVMQWADPYIQKAASLLDINPDTIDLSSPQWSFILKPGQETNPTTGQPTGASTGQAISLDDLQKQIQTNPVYNYWSTNNGIQQGSQLGAQLAKVFSGGSSL